MNDNKIFESFAEKPLEFTFTLEPRNWFEKLLFRFKVRPNVRVVHVKPITFGARALYSKYALKLDIDKIAKDVSKTRAQLLVSEHIDALVMAIAIVLNNKESVPPKWMLREIRNLSQVELNDLLLFVQASIDTDSFLSSIISINGMSLKTEEIIAPEESESPVRTK
ncbi:hypothetical protein [Sphingobacterium deserti]|uniref:Uncharacterized protein n=1 Tax=Sphingobacterium deserti TaxID=1229276 RepID=A0A0B8T4G1_9SPHI|nr:hypothetical protein [Sphingobacterium deserti]KGE14618.1 hypothetical protein DI53_1647 [Sphingobacterium deserti]